jgi:hypothetical protein
MDCTQLPSWMKWSPTTKSSLRFRAWPDGEFSIFTAEDAKNCRECGSFWFLRGTLRPLRLNHSLGS